jgi:hypothetical protein
MKASAFLLLVLLASIPGCWLDSGPLRATWSYVELTKSDNGEVKETGDKHTLRSGGDEMYEIRENRLEVVTVTSAKAKFRLSSRDVEDRREVELKPGGAQEVWLGRFGVRLHVETIGTMQ